jgi:uncharacterized membrane protein YeaQ/YmgE (transglycosylase-associated protein family)
MARHGRFGLFSQGFRVIPVANPGHCGKETVAYPRRQSEVPRQFASAGYNIGREAMELLHHGFFGWILIGLVAGVLGKIIMPGKDPGGFIVTILIGIAGALLAGYLSPMMGLHIAAGWQSYAAATVGAIVLLALYRLVMTRRT